MAVPDDPRTLLVGEPITCRTAVGGKVVSFDSRVRYVDATGFYIDRPGGLGAELMPGEELLVRYIRSDAAYQFLTLIKQPPLQDDEGDEGVRPEPDASRRVLQHDPLLLRFPQRITRFQRRAHPRSTQEGVIQVRRATGDTRDWRGYIVDLSAGGVRFATRQAGFLAEGRNPVGTKVLCSILMTKGLELTQLLAEVKRVTIETDADDEDYLLVQVAFVDLPAKTASKIESWLAKRSRA